MNNKYPATAIYINGKKNPAKAYVSPLHKTEQNAKEVKPKPWSRAKDYENFCKAIFKERSFISQRQFNLELEMEFNKNTSYYRKRMLKLGLISQKNNLIKYLK